MSAITGISEEETRRALCVLVSLGALTVSAAKTVDDEPVSPPLDPPDALQSPPVADRPAVDDAAINPSFDAANREEPTPDAADADDWFSGTEVWSDKYKETARDRHANAPAAVPPPIAGSKAISEEEREAAWVLNEVSCKLMQFEIASYYEVLGVDRFATTTAIRQAYYDLEQMFESFQTRWPANHELNGKLTELLALINQAYATLSDPHRRREYDMPASRRTRARETRKAEPSVPKDRNASPPASLKSIPPPAPLKSAPPTAAAPFVPSPQSPLMASPPAMVDDPVQNASEIYRQGRARYEQRDFHAAAHLLREAARLDPSRAEHHYLLAQTLMVLSQARHMHDGHEGCHVTCNLGGALVRNQRTRYEAVQHFREAAQLDRRNAQIRIQLGLLYKAAGMHKKAEACFWEALLIDGKNETAMQELGLDNQTEVSRSANPLAPKAAKKDRRKAE